MKLFFAKALSSLFPFKHQRHIIRNAIKHSATIEIIKQYYQNLKNKDKEDSFENFLSLCAIAKNEGAYFKEWIEYHLLIGVEKFYIYDNDSDDNTCEILKPYIAQGIVEYINYPGEKKQISAYRDCIKRCVYRTKWLAILDMDEYIVPTGEKEIKTYLQELPVNISQVHIKWRCFGSNDHKKKPDGLVLENYLYRGQGTPHHKSIVKPHHILLLTSPHHSCVMQKTIATDTSHEYNAQKEKFRINHYHCKSKEEYMQRTTRGSANSGKIDTIHTPESFYARDTNDVYDDVILKYSDKVKKKIVKRSSS